MLRNGHVRFGGRVGETDRRQRRHRAPARPRPLSDGEARRGRLGNRIDENRAVDLGWVRTRVQPHKQATGRVTNEHEWTPDPRRADQGVQIGDRVSRRAGHPNRGAATAPRSPERRPRPVIRAHSSEPRHRGKHRLSLARLRGLDPNVSIVAEPRFQDHGGATTTAADEVELAPVGQHDMPRKTRALGPHGERTSQQPAQPDHGRQPQQPNRNHRPIILSRAKQAAAADTRAQPTATSAGECMRVGPGSRF